MHEEGRGGSHPKHNTAFQHLWIEGLGREFQLWQLHWEEWEGLGMHCRLQPGLREAGAISELIPWKTSPGCVQHKFHMDTR